MIQNPIRIGIATGSALVIVALCALAQSDAAKPAQGDAAKPSVTKITGKTLIAASELKWVPLPGITGAEQALLVGDPAKEAHRVFYKFPVGLKAPLHSHTSGDRGVIVSGVLSLAVDGAPAKNLPAGSFFSIAGGVTHVTAVEGNAPCVFFVEREGPFDVVMVEEAGAKKK